MTHKISVVIITKNSQDYIEKCLQSVMWADEIVIVDDYSKDDTVKIAQKFNVKIYTHKWQGFANQKNYAISKTTNKWVLSIDSDELVDDQLKENILHLNPKKYDGFYIARKNFIGKTWIKHSGFYPDWQLRFFQNHLRFENLPVHEQVKAKKVSKISGHIVHLTYRNHREYLKKVKKYSKLDALVLFNKSRRYSLLYQYLKPVKEFLDRLILKKGILDGYNGLVIALYSSYSKYLAAKHLKKLYENSN
jgi:glycosyltransferase involved in cell wall biosynthesis